MSPETRDETQQIDNLGIVAGICQEIGLIEEIVRISNMWWYYNTSHV